MARGITQEVAAERAELNLRTLQRVEAGETNVLATTVLRLRAAVGCRWTDLLGPDDPPVVEKKRGAKVMGRRSKP